MTMIPICIRFRMTNHSFFEKKKTVLYVYAACAAILSSGTPDLHSTNAFNMRFVKYEESDLLMKEFSANCRNSTTDY